MYHSTFRQKLAIESLHQQVFANSRIDLVSDLDPFQFLYSLLPDDRYSIGMMLCEATEIVAVAGAVRLGKDLVSIARQFLIVHLPYF
ncbi:hypothetical protein C7B80_11625 [Cyanosarcina cf. burmensis CCALA 770]|nr:hypothetical protein C7B80_11625 [Cyanosarcina cf. burmensis CCALA 770]